MVKIGFIGMGNMGSTILNGLLRAHGPEEIIFLAACQDRMEAVTVRAKAPHARSNRECVGAIKYLILAIKPQYSDTVFSEIGDVVIPERVVVSLAPGIIVSNITGRLGENVRMVKTIPNISAMLEEGMTGVSYGEASYTEEEKETTRDVFSPCGRVEPVEEQLMDAVGRAGGSSSAFMHMFTEALADGGAKYGLPRETAHAMAAQTVPGSAKIILEAGKHPGQPKNKICSPGGTVIAGVSALEEYGLRSAAIKAADAYYERIRRTKQNNDIKP